MLDDRAKGLIRGLMYPVMFQHLPIDGVDRVMSQIVKRGALNATAAEYKAAIDAALGSGFGARQE